MKKKGVMKNKYDLSVLQREKFIEMLEYLYPEVYFIEWDVQGLHETENISFFKKVEINSKLEMPEYIRICHYLILCEKDIPKRIQFLAKGTTIIDFWDSVSLNNELKYAERNIENFHPIDYLYNLYEKVKFHKESIQSIIGNIVLETN